MRGCRWLRINFVSELILLYLKILRYGYTKENKNKNKKYNNIFPIFTNYVIKINCSYEEKYIPKVQT